ncbi:MAG: TM1812 family CRISPR-associated protein [Candidatus Nitrosocaldus sp.]
MSIIIYQILGKAGKDRYSDVDFTIVDKDLIDEKIYKGKRLSSEALYNYYIEHDNNVDKIVLLKPESLAPDQPLQSVIDTSIVDASIKEKTEVIPIQAVGTYNNIHYNGTPTNILLQIFADMVKRSTSMNDVPNIVIDLSTGYNIYVVSLFEAARFYTSYMHLSSGDLSRTFVRYAISEPVQGSGTYRIFVDELQTRTTFDLPKHDNLTKFIDADDTYKARIGKMFSSTNSGLNTINKNLRLTYNAIRYNAPLFLFTNSINLDYANSRDIVIGLCNFVEEVLKNKGIMLKRSLYNLFLIIAMYNGIRHMLKDLLAKKGDGVPLDALKQFESIYNRLGLDLNWRFLEKEISEIESYKDKISKEWKMYKDIRTKDVDQQERVQDERGSNKQSDIKRNFFAHAGLSYDTLELCIDDGNILCRYKDGKIQEIKGWIENPK